MTAELSIHDGKTVNSSSLCNKPPPFIEIIGETEERKVSLMDDERIIELFFERSEQAITALSEKYGRVFMKVSMNALGSVRDAEECVNDAYLGCWNAIPPARPKPLLTYVCRIVRNISINRYHSRLRRGGNYELCLDELAEVIPADGSVEDEAAERRLSGYIDEFLDNCSELDRFIFVRRYWYMDSFEDVAEAAGLKAGACRTRLSRTRAALKAFLKEKEVEV